MVYVLLTLAGLAAVAFIARQERQPVQLAATFAVAAAVIVLADWVAFGWFNLYSYAPHLVSDPRADCALGELLADILFAPSLAVLVAAHLPEAYGAVLCTFTVTAVEYLFLRAGFFRHSGWQAWYTALLFPLYFLLVGKVRKRLDQVGPENPAMHRLIQGALLFVLVGVYTLGLRPFDLTETNLHVMPERIGNQSLGRFLTYPTIFVPIGYWVMAGGRPQRWGRLLAAAAALAAWNLFFVAIGFQHYRHPYTWYLDALGQAAVLWLACVCDDLLQRQGAGAETRAV